MLTKKLLALAAVVLFAGVAVAGMTRAADTAKARGDCQYSSESDIVCPDQGTQVGPVTPPANWEGQGGGTE